MSRRQRKQAVTGLFLVGVLAAAVLASAIASLGLPGGEGRSRAERVEMEVPTEELPPPAPTPTQGSAEATRLASTEVGADAGQTAGEAAPAAPALATAEVVNYIVLPGDTLLELAEHYETTVAKLMAINPGLDPARMRAGDLIKVPDRAAERGQFRPRQVWPAEGPITTPFGEQGSSWIGGYHMGLDIGGYTGDVIWAADEGIILDAGTNGRGRGYGTYILMYHFQGWYTLYAHLSEVYRPIGYVARKGEPIGEVGTTGFSNGPHLHFEVWKDGEKLDPIQFLP